MSVNINLLLRTDEGSLKQKKRIKILNIVAAAFLIGVGLISLGIFISIQAVNPESLKKEQEDVQGRISKLQKRQRNLFILNNRVENIDKILKIRSNLSKAMSDLLANVPSDLLIKKFEIDKTSVAISGESRSLYTIGELIENLTDMARKKEIIKSLMLSSLSFSKGTNVYQIEIKSQL